jgi:hypothetical protein
MGVEVAQGSVARGADLSESTTIAFAAGFHNPGKAARKALHTSPSGPRQTQLPSDSAPQDPSIELLCSLFGA